ncbi:MAG: amino acid permease, partial [Cytophagaceae bacterium]
WMSMDYLSAARGHTEVESLLAEGTLWKDLFSGQQAAWLAWENAPNVAGIPVIADIPALVIVFLITLLVYVGIKKTKKAANLLVLLKMIVILMVIAIGAFYVNPENWSPFAPTGFSGVLSGVAAVFFAYIGFDAISTTAEETKNPQRDLPLSMILSLIISTILYVAIALILTGMVHYSELGVGDPLAYVFNRVGLNFISGIVALSAIIAMAGVLLVFQLGQPRIWMSMSRDGLLPAVFSKIHPRFHTPAFATIVTGFVVAIPALFMNLEEVTDLTSIGTLFAFAVVCGGVLVKKPAKEGQFKIPYANSRIYIPLLIILMMVLIMYYGPASFMEYFSPTDGPFTEKLPLWIFAVVGSALCLLSIIKQLSLIPVLGLLSNIYLMSELGFSNWVRFGIWLAAGLVVYFIYGIKNSKLRNTET